MIAKTTAFATAVLASSALASDAGAPQCTCTASCSASGDPHVVSFYGKDETLGGTDFVLYQIGDFAVTADTFGQDYMNEITFGETKLSIADCSYSGESLANLTHVFDDLGSNLTANVWCKMPENTGTHGNSFHLNIDMVKSDVGSDSFKASEQASGATGACTDGQSDQRRLRALSGDDDSTIQCVCESLCQARGDPHLTSFFGVNATLTDSEITLYQDEDCSVNVKTFDANFILEVDFNGETVSASQCTEEGQVLMNETKGSSSSAVKVRVKCQLPSNPDHPTHLDVGVHKTDVGGDSSFPGMEKQAHGVGACMTPRLYASNSFVL